MNQKIQAAIELKYNFVSRRIAVCKAVDSRCNYLLKKLLHRRISNVCTVYKKTNLLCQIIAILELWCWCLNFSAPGSYLKPKCKNQHVQQLFQVYKRLHLLHGEQNSMKSQVNWLKLTTALPSFCHSMPKHVKNIKLHLKFPFYLQSLSTIVLPLHLHHLHLLPCHHFSPNYHEHGFQTFA